MGGSAASALLVSDSKAADSAATCSENLVAARTRDCGSRHGAGVCQRKQHLVRNARLRVTATRYGMQWHPDVIHKPEHPIEPLGYAETLRQQAAFS
jgi:hypothetical protein